MTGQRFLGDGLGFWVGTVESGEIDAAEGWDDGTAIFNVSLSEADLLIIEAALKRQFVAVKKGRTQVMHAVKQVRLELGR